MTRNERLFQRLDEINELLEALTCEAYALRDSVDPSEENEWIIFPALDAARIAIRDAGIKVNNLVADAQQELRELREKRDERSA